MCRMIVALGNIEIDKLLEDIIIMAKGLNEINEKNKKKGMFTHGEGWGIAYIKKTRWHLYKSGLAIYNDPQVEELKKLKCKAVVIHARRRTIGDRSIENIQPLKFSSNNKDFIFAHNGTIFDDLTVYHEYIKGNSDSVKMFNNILYAYAHNDQSFTVKDYTAVNFILVSSKHVQIVQKYKMNPMYSTMKLLKAKNRIIVSSEILPSYDTEKWNSLKNNTTLEFDLDKH